MANGRLYLIPSPLGEYDPAEVIPRPVLDRLKSIRKYVVEEVRTVRRYLSAVGVPSGSENISSKASTSLADPGAQLVALCHIHGIQVVPLVGPSSLMLALMGSGLNGQSFAFCGYLPAKTDERRKAVREIERRSAQLDQTEIFIETPYRNDSMMADLLATLQPQTRLCVAADITLPEETVLTKSVKEWKRSPISIGKRPCVFLLLASSGH